jgi:hypothetical protein
VRASDVIANRQIDVWEIAYVLCWPVEKKSWLNPLESHLFHLFHPKSPLMNGSIPAKMGPLTFAVQDPVEIQLLPDEEIKDRLRTERRLPRQAKHFSELLDHFLNVKDAKELLLALQAHFSRLSKYFNELRPTVSDKQDSRRAPDD